MKLTPLAPFILGIDPGKKTGWAVLRRSDEKIVSMGTSSFYKMQLLIANTYKDRKEVKIYVEHPPTFLYERNESTIRNEELTKMFYAGGNRREAELLHMCLAARGYDAELVAPVREKKWTNEKFQLFTRSTQVVNEHVRDAVRLAVYYMNHRKELMR